MEANMLLLITLSFSFFLSCFPLSLSQPDKEYRECRPSMCGKVGKIEYPFWSEEIGRPRYCGRSPAFKLKCPQHEYQYPSIEIDSHTFNVTNIDPSAPTMTLLPRDFVYNNCSPHLPNTSLSIGPNIFHHDNPSSVKNVTLFYGCPTYPDHPIQGFNFTCHPGTASKPNSNNIYAFYSEVLNEPLLPYLIENCAHHIEVPVSIETYEYPQDHSQDLEEALGKGFVVQYDFDESCGTCWESDGRCGSNDTSPFICYCLDGHHPLHCPYAPHPSDSPDIVVSQGVYWQREKEWSSGHRNHPSLPSIQKASSC